MAQATASPASQSQQAIAPAARAANSATPKTPNASDRRKSRGRAKEGSGSPDIQAARLCKIKPTPTAPITSKGGITNDRHPPPKPNRLRPAQAIRKKTQSDKGSDQRAGKRGRKAPSTSR